MSTLEKLQAAYTAANTKTSTKEHTQQEKDDCTDAILWCKEEKMLLSFGMAAKMILNWTGGSYPRNATGKLVDLFSEVEEGADALLISKSGKYGEKVAEQHLAWLDSQGFEDIKVLK